MTNNYQIELKHQIDKLWDEAMRVKAFINTNGFDCTTAPFVIAKRYRDELKQHIKLLQMNLDELTNEQPD